MSILFLILLLNLLTILIRCDDEPIAKMFLYKYTETDPVVQGKSLIITYKVMNTGDATARDIKITEKYDKNSFDFIKDVNEDGQVLFTLEELAPGTEMTFNIEIIPKVKGRYGYEIPERAKMTYFANPITIDGTEDEDTLSWSTNLKVRIIDAAEYQRNISYNIKEWGIFFALYCLPIILSFLQWKSASATINNSIKSSQVVKSPIKFSSEKSKKN